MPGQYTDHMCVRQQRLRGCREHGHLSHSETLQGQRAQRRLHMSGCACWLQWSGIGNVLFVVSCGDLCCRCERLCYGYHLGVREWLHWFLSIGVLLRAHLRQQGVRCGRRLRH